MLAISHCRDQIGLSVIISFYITFPLFFKTLRLFPIQNISDQQNFPICPPGKNCVHTK